MPLQTVRIQRRSIVCVCVFLWNTMQKAHYDMRNFLITRKGGNNIIRLVPVPAMGGLCVSFWDSTAVALFTTDCRIRRITDMTCACVCMCVCDFPLCETYPFVSAVSLIFEKLFLLRKAIIIAVVTTNMVSHYCIANKGNPCSHENTFVWHDIIFVGGEMMTISDIYNDFLDAIITWLLL